MLLFQVFKYSLTANGYSTHGRWCVGGLGRRGAFTLLETPPVGNPFGRPLGVSPIVTQSLQVTMAVFAVGGFCCLKFVNREDGVPRAAIPVALAVVRVATSVARAGGVVAGRAFQRLGWVLAEGLSTRTPKGRRSTEARSEHPSDLDR